MHLDAKIGDNTDENEPKGWRVISRKEWLFERRSSAAAARRVQAAEAAMAAARKDLADAKGAKFSAQEQLTRLDAKARLRRVQEKEMKKGRKSYIGCNNLWTLA